jgi:hypothetical protein
MEILDKRKVTFLYRMSVFVFKYLTSFTVRNVSHVTL